MEKDQKKMSAALDRVTGDRIDLVSLKEGTLGLVYCAYLYILAHILGIQSHFHIERFLTSENIP